MSANKYKADLGSWRGGIQIEFTAENIDSALRIAGEILDKSIEEKEIPSSSVIVQLKENGRCVYDYMNGVHKPLPKVEPLAFQ